MGSGSSAVRHPHLVDIYRSQSFYRTVEDIPAVAYNEKRILQCHVTYVVDGDSLRCRHIPVAPSESQNALSTRKTQRAALDATALDLEEGKLRDETILVRVAGIDAPEAANAKGPGQPFAEESTACVKQHCLHSTVLIKLLNKDQYGRPLVRILIPADEASVANCGGQRATKNPLQRLARLCCRSRPELPPPQDLGELLLKQGLAVVYYGRGAEYDGQKHVYEQRMREAQRNKRGLWSLTESGLEVPGAYKRKLLATATVQQESSKVSWKRRVGCHQTLPKKPPHVFFVTFVVQPGDNFNERKAILETSLHEQVEAKESDSHPCGSRNRSRGPKRYAPQSRKNHATVPVTDEKGPIVWQGWHHQDSTNEECEDFDETWNSVLNQSLQQNNPNRLQPENKKKKKKRQRRRRGQRH